MGIFAVCQTVTPCLQNHKKGKDKKREMTSYQVGKSYVSCEIVSILLETFFRVIYFMATDLMQLEMT